MPHGIHSDLAELVDDPEALQLVRDTVRAVSPRQAAAFDGPLRYEAGSTLRTALLFGPPSTAAAVDAALRDLNRSRGLAR